MEVWHSTKSLRVWGQAAGGVPVAYSYSKKHSPCAPHLFLPLDGVDPCTYLDKQSPRLALTLVQKVSSSCPRRARMLTGDSHHYNISRYGICYRDKSGIDLDLRVDIPTYMCFRVRTCP